MGPLAREHWAADLYRAIYPMAYLSAVDVPPELHAAARAALFADADVAGQASLADSVEAVWALAAAGYLVGVISNNRRRGVRWLLADIGLAERDRPGPLAAVIDSAEVGVGKPDPAIFQHALAAVGVPAQRAVYVGDSLRLDRPGAEAVGMAFRHFDPFAVCLDGRHRHLAALCQLRDPDAGEGQQLAQVSLRLEQGYHRGL
jgi:FMN phosphatase YigB (HAD superfamily)